MVSNKEEPKEITLNDVFEALQGIQNKLEEILIWQRISGANKVRELLISSLGTPERKLVYHLSDGRSTKEIVETSKVSAGSVSGYWKTWKNLGLMKTQKVMGGERSMRIFDLEDFGIDIPKINLKQQAAVSSQQILSESASNIQEEEKQ